VSPHLLILLALIVVAVVVAAVAVVAIRADSRRRALAASTERDRSTR
jgi:hypothetical protein